MASDLWSLGLSLVEISFGQYPIPPPDQQNLVKMFGPQILEDPALATLAAPNPRTPKSPRTQEMTPMSIFELLTYIVDDNQPPPKLPYKVFSENMRDFVDKCLKKSPKERPDLATLMKHPWLEGVEDDTTIDIAEWVWEYCKNSTSLSVN